MDMNEKLAELKTKIPAVIEEHVISDDGDRRIYSTNIIPLELKRVLDDLYDIIENLSKENEYLRSKIQDEAKREDIDGRIYEILCDPCGRDTSRYGPSRTEESIIKICEIIRDLIK